MKKRLNVQKLVPAYKKQVLKEINSIKSEEYQTQIFRFLVKQHKIKYRTNEQGVFFYLETLELVVLYNIHGIYLGYYYSNKCSADLVSTIDINEKYKY